MMQHVLTSILTLLLISTSCWSQTGEKNYILTKYERSIADSLGIDTMIIQSIREHNSYKIEPFHYSLSRILTKDSSIEVDPILLKGLVFSEKNSNSYELVFALKDNFRIKGYSIFLLENNFNIRNQPDRIGVLKTTDKYTVLEQIQTDGINYGIDNDSLISVIKFFDKKYSLELIGASGDWCEFIVLKEPQNWLQFAKEVYKVCPDVVDQGSGTVKDLAEDMKKTKRLFFWWD